MTITQHMAAEFTVRRSRPPELLERVCAEVTDSVACMKRQRFLNALAEAGLDAVLNQFAWLRIRSTS